MFGYHRRIDKLEFKATDLYHQIQDLEKVVTSVADRLDGLTKIVAEAHGFKMMFDWIVTETKPVEKKHE